MISVDKREQIRTNCFIVLFWKCTNLIHEYANYIPPCISTYKLWLLYKSNVSSNFRRVFHHFLLTLQTNLKFKFFLWEKQYKWKFNIVFNFMIQIITEINLSLVATFLLKCIIVIHNRPFKWQRIISWVSF